MINIYICDNNDTRDITYKKQFARVPKLCEEA
jgi:hypothetical protein